MGILAACVLSGCSTASPTQTTAQFLVSVPGAVTEIGTLTAAAYLLKTLLNDIQRDAEDTQARPKECFLPLRGRWLQYLLVCLIMAGAIPFIFAGLMLLSIAAAWALKLVFPNLPF